MNNFFITDKFVIQYKITNTFYVKPFITKMLFSTGGDLEFHSDEFSGGILLWGGWNWVFYTRWRRRVFIGQ
jgi:hypothetical protein